MTTVFISYLLSILGYIILLAPLLLPVIIFSFFAVHAALKYDSVKACIMLGKFNLVYTLVLEYGMAYPFNLLIGFWCPIAFCLSIIAGITLLVCFCLKKCSLIKLLEGLLLNFIWFLWGLSAY